MKDKNGIDEITILLQGVSLPNPGLTANEDLLAAQDRPTVTVQPIDPVVIQEADDLSGMALVRSHKSTSAQIGNITGATAPGQSSSPVQCKEISRTTQWRHNKKAAHTDVSQILRVAKKPRKDYGSSGCKTCHEPLLSDGHKQYYGSRYCPKENKPFDQWLLDVKATMAAKKTAKESE